MGLCSGSSRGKVHFCPEKALSNVQINYATTHYVLKTLPQIRKELKVLVRQELNATQVMTELLPVIYWFLLLIFGESRKQERCQKTGNWARRTII